MNMTLQLYECSTDSPVKSAGEFDPEWSPQVESAWCKALHGGVHELAMQGAKVA